MLRDASRQGVAVALVAAAMLFTMADGQWDWNPFAQFAQPQQQAFNFFQPFQQQQQAWQGGQGQFGTQRNPEQIYGTPGRRNANQKLRTCCRSLKDADVECRRRYCDFDTFTGGQVLGFLGQCVSKGPTVGQMWDCASSRADHRECCQRQGVLPACMAYCETTNGVPTDYVKYAFCIGQFDRIRNCFREHLDTHPNIKGDT